MLHFHRQTTFLSGRVSVAPDFSREQKRGFASRRLSIRLFGVLF